MKLDPLSVMMEFGNLKRWTMSWKKAAACTNFSDVIGLAFYPFCELVYGDKKMGVAPGRFCQGANHV
jgi:hypothetical protein